MAVTLEDVEKVAYLARLKLSGEKGRFISQLNRILDYIAQLEELDTGGVPPTSHVLPLKNVFREDEARPSVPREELMANAPAEHMGYFKVPRAIE
ncbi:MAG TPA: Asp-tRNA(Asn)/Glu-tRNA(Gln) amidotransferase subunit GatC [Candidatus Latescibacteria bacterium]|nr:Asp-tRNA(Asn)/Glu-tRNA(Gln) amidotransferase subunit GatC [Candidatus Latescibacterota bacterium]